MATKATITSEIQSKIGTTEYDIWRIGLTHDPTERKQCWKDDEHQTVDYWKQWIADSLSDAQYIESYFIAKGMKGGTGGNLVTYKTVYVYVF